MTKIDKGINDRVVIGKVEPDFLLSFSTSFSYKNFDFYVSLNEYFNTTKQPTLNVESIEYTTKLLFSISAFGSLLKLTIPQSIPSSSFLIHSAINYNINQDLSLSKYDEAYPNAITTLVLLEHKYPYVFSLIINAFISNSIDYANRYSTEFSLINGYLEVLDKFTDLETALFSSLYIVYFCKMFEW